VRFRVNGSQIRGLGDGVSQVENVETSVGSAGRET
jgi:hypothetical protein